MLPWESTLFREGAGCPSCEGIPNGFTPSTMSDVDNGDEDPMMRILAAERVANGTAPKWERPADPVHWTCDGCGVEVITDLDACAQDGSKATEVLEYRCPFPFEGNRYQVERHGEPEKTPAHTFDDFKVCEFCLEHCDECGTALCDKVSTDTYDGMSSFPLPGDPYGNRRVCVDCLDKVEDDEAQRVWQDCYSTSERIEYMREHRSQFDCLYVPREPSKPETCAHFVDRWRDILANARGRYFGGYASEIIS